MLVTIKSDKYSATVDSLGAQLISFKYEGVEYIWQRDKTFWEDCAPILFPIVGSVVDKTFIVDGNSYQMDTHGFACLEEFDLLSQQEDSVSFILKSNDESLKIYPFKFELIVSYILDDEGIKTHFKVVNADNREILFGIGGHPGFNWPLFEGDGEEDYLLEFDKDYELSYYGSSDESYLLPEITYTLKTENKQIPLKRKLLDIHTVVIDRPPFNNVKYVNKKGRGIDFKFDNFTSFAIWTYPEPIKSPFVSFEPWNSTGKKWGDSKKLNEKKDIVRLEKGKEFECSYKICPIG